MVGPRSVREFVRELNPKTSKTRKTGDANLQRLR